MSIEIWFDPYLLNQWKKESRKMMREKSKLAKTINPENYDKILDELFGPVESEPKREGE